jgi:hypothetical protein
MSCCNALVYLDDAPLEGDTIDVQEHPPRTANWPKLCDQCGHPFVDTDHWQVFTDWLFKNSETGELHELRKLPPGAMYHTHWYDDDMRGPDGLALTVMLPDRTPWCIDGYAHNNGVRTPHGWTRTGTPPNVSVSPSILTPNYHGWLRNGVLESC